MKNIKKLTYSDYLKIFRQIKNDYSIIKQKKLLHYFSEKSEKDFIKEVKKWNNPNSNNFKYIRAYLGLAENFDDERANVKINVEDITKEIERFKSPINFIVFNNYIYLNWEEIPERMIETNFQFSFKKVGQKSSYKQELLKTPNVKTNFLNNFLPDVLTELNYRKI
ncbi:MAG: hypothetical protein U9Q83_10330 [Bacteroidota bacterium]|nr:hypothetical protein [Bacteroidota bacterium]